MTGTWWSKAERSELLEMVGNLPWSEVVTRYRHWARRNGYPARTDGAMRAICEKANASRIAVGAWVNTGAVISALGIGYPMLQRLLSSGLLKGRREGRRWYIYRDSIRQLAQINPDLFAGRPRADLLLLLDSQRLAEQLAEQRAQWIHGRPRQVQCVETGEVFHSMAAAGRQVHASRSAVFLAASGRRETAAGLHWRYLDQEAA